MIKFGTERFYTNSGTKDRTKFKLMYSPVTNVLEVTKIGKENFQSYIESFRDGCDLSIIMQKVAIGDLSGLSAINAVYGDISEMPDDPYSVMNARLEVNRMYDSLPDDIKAKFGSEEIFLNQAGTERWFENLGVNINPPDPVKESEVSE